MKGKHLSVLAAAAAVICLVTAAFAAKTDNWGVFSETDDVSGGYKMFDAKTSLDTSLGSLEFGGGCSEKGSVKSCVADVVDFVEPKSTASDKWVVGGMGETDVSDCMLNLTNAKVTEVRGADSSKGNICNNAVNVKSSEISKDITGAYFAAAGSGSGLIEVKNNVVNIVSDSKVLEDVRCVHISSYSDGYRYNCKISDNILNIRDSQIYGNVYDVCFSDGSGAYELKYTCSNNKICIYDGAEVYGKIYSQKNKPSSVSNFALAAPNAADDSNYIIIYDGAAVGGDISGDKVVIYGGTIDSNSISGDLTVYGGTFNGYQPTASQLGAGCSIDATGKVTNEVSIKTEEPIKVRAGETKKLDLTLVKGTETMSVDNCEIQGLPEEITAEVKDGCVFLEVAEGCEAGEYDAVLTATRTVETVGTYGAQKAVKVNVSNGGGSSSSSGCNLGFAALAMLGLAFVSVRRKK
ncbi:MAG: Synerg-CTERM sorting domain-containing protein [Synergistes sp.]|nr:Synerg-CTERM sorting domain-containing protein [Synergistes sp.]